MAKHPREKLTPLSVRRLRAGRHADGEGLYLLVDVTGGRRWLLRTLIRGKRCDIGLGTLRYGDDELRRVRTEARALRDVARAGGDPLSDRRAARAALRVAEMAETARQKTFREFADEYIEIKRPEWANEKHGKQWESTLSTHVYPVFGDVPVPLVDSQHVIAALKPIWTTLPETASRVRGRIASILDAAKATKLRTGDNPADWKGALQASLPSLDRKATTVHHAALPYGVIAAFLVDLDQQEGTAAQALHFGILTAARTTEVLGARWEEVDFEERHWTIPKERMKAGREHRVPLSLAAIEILESLPRAGEFIFPSNVRRDKPKPMSNMAMASVLKRMGRTDITVHGFRSTFRDWAGETTTHPREVIEHALAHQLADKAEAAYQRGDLLRKRAALMDDWARYCATSRPSAAQVTPIRKIAGAVHG